jgi:hypothetical protein
MKNIRHQLYGTIHQKAKVLGLEAAMYRGFLFALTSKQSCKDLTTTELESVDDILSEKVLELRGHWSDKLLSYEEAQKRLADAELPVDVSSWSASQMLYAAKVLQ